MSQLEVLAHCRLMLYIHGPETNGELNEAGIKMLRKAIAALVADTAE